MTLKKVPQTLLRLMADGQFHSGEEIGELMGISRAAVWKQLQKLEELGLAFESVKGKGYRLLDVLDFLDEEAIAACLADVQPKPQIHIHDVIDSTNAELLRLLTQSPLPQQACCVLAEMQQAGRGRRGRQWVSPYGRNLYFSMLWSFERGMASLDGLSLLVGLCVLKAMQPRVLQTLQLKWPNDVLADRQKLAGILLEIVGDPTGLCHVVIGIGVNVNWQKDGRASGIDQPWTSLSALAGQAVERNSLVAALLRELLVVLPRFAQQGFAPFADAWQQHDAFAGQEVMLQSGEQVVLGVAAGVGEKGELKLLTAQGVQLFHGGEVSLRRRL